MKPPVRCLAALALAGAVPSGSAHAQVRYAAAVTAAEREAAYVPRAGDTSAEPRRCTSVTKQVERSGDFESRGWADYAASWYGGYGKLSWWPAHARADDSLTVRIVPAEDGSDTTTYHFGGPVRSGGVGAYLYPSSVRPGRPGAWLFIATAGTNWGCFLYVLPDTNPGFAPRPRGP